MAVDERRIRRHLSSAQSAMQRAQNTLDDLLDKAAGALPPKLQQQAQQLQQAQRELAQEAERAQQAAAAMQEQGPVVGAEAAEQLGEAGEAMGEAAQAFAQGRPGPGHQQQNAALDALKKMQQSLQQAMQPGGAGGAGGMPMPMGKRRPGPPPGSGTSPGSHNDAEVAIPKGDLPNNAWREQLLDHAKQPPPLHYEEAVRRYYDELMR
jgi:hypothetical protein